MNSIDVTVTVENLAPEQGTQIAPFWFSFHDGSFDLFDVGAPASDGLELIAEDGLIGLEFEKIPGLLEDSLAEGLDPDKAASVSPESTLAGEFAASEAAANGGIQDIAVANTREPFFLLQEPGETVSTTVTLNSNSDINRFFSYAAMVFPTNDGFIGNDDPTSIEIFDSEGNFVGADFIVLGNQILDAGTEVNDEDPVNVPFTLVEFLDGLDENGTVQNFPGFLPAGDGGVLDFELNGEQIFANSDFTVDDYQVARITITASTPSPEPELVFGNSENDTFEAGIDFKGDNAFVFTGAGQDLVDASQTDAGGNQIFGGTGTDEIFAGKGDRVSGGSENDILDASAGAGSNRLYGSDGDDELWAGEGDRLFGGEGDDLLNSSIGNGNNRLYGEDGDDILIAGSSDRLLGGEGNDTFFITEGSDNLMTGGAGADAFWIANGEFLTSVNTITDFELEVDVIGVAGLGATSINDLEFSQVGNDVIISFADFDLAQLLNTQMSELSANGTFAFA